MRSDTAFLLAAALLHAALLGAYWLVPSAPPRSPSLVELRAIDVERLEDLPPDLAPPPPPPPPSEPPRADLSTVPTSFRPRASAPSIDAAPSAAESAPKREAYSPRVEEAQGVLAVPGVSGPGAWSIPGVVPNMAPPPPAPTAGALPRPVDKDIGGVVVREAMRENDKKIGLDLPAAGTVATAVRDVVRSSDTPNEGRASFEVRLGADGKVLGVKVTSARGGAQDAWERAAQAVIAALRGRMLAMRPPFERGATVHVDVTSALLLPDGSHKGHAESLAIADPDPVIPGYTDVGRADRMHAFNAGGQFMLTGQITFDFSNIGAHNPRVVRTTFRTIPAP